jgi:hypothetical protein
MEIQIRFRAFPSAHPEEHRVSDNRQSLEFGKGDGDVFGEADLHEIARRYPTDKGENGYLPAYEERFSSLRHAPVALLELGVLKGASLLMWQDYFTLGVSGLDRKPADVRGERIKVYQGDQQDKAVLDRIASERGPFDIIIDDAAHIGTIARESFWHLFRNHLKPGGLYVVEDWGTGYWRDWPDGVGYRPNRGKWLIKLLRRDANFTAHNFGMVGFIKELVDDCALEDITHPRGNGERQSSLISDITLRRGQAFVRKAS